MENFIEITCKNNNTIKTYERGVSLESIISDQNIKLNYSILGALVNNELEELNYQLYKPKTIKFIDISNEDGMRMYIRSLSFVLIKAVKDLNPKSEINIEHSVSNGIYCEITEFDNTDTSQIASDIKNLMQKIIDKNYPFIRKDLERDKAIKLYKKHKFTEKLKLFKTQKKFYSSVYYLDGLVDYFYGYLVPSTVYLKVFDLLSYENGFLLRIPKKTNPNELRDIIKQKQMFNIFKEYKNWSEILDVKSIGSINEIILSNKESELIKISEALHEKKVAQIADEVYKRRENVRLILISGPSASGKTTFSKRLSIQLKVLGLKPIQISLDNYFVDREKTPKDKNGEYNFEALEALDLELFNKNLLSLFAQKEIKVPSFSFETGKQFFSGKTLKLCKNNILIVEGIHGLNPQLTSNIDDNLKFKIYISALTQIGIDNHNRIPTTDNRLIRRIVRDYKHRGYSALETLKRWDSVRKGEDEHIFPYQEEADIMFNSALLYDLAVLKMYVTPLLEEIQQLEPQYAEAKRLLKFLSYFVPIKSDEIPPTSILREFLSGSSFIY